MTPQPASAGPLEASPLFDGLAAEQVASLRATMIAREFTTGDVVLDAGTVSAGIHFVEAGEAEVLAPAATAERPVAIARLGPGQAFGELSAMTGSPAITTVRAARTPTRVRTLETHRIDALPDHLAIAGTLLRNVIRVNQQRLSRVNLSYVEQLEQTLALLTLRNSSARLLILVIALMCITILTNHWLTQRPGIDVYSPAFAWSALVTIVLPTLVVAWRERHPLDSLGITTRNLARDLAWSAAITGIVLAVAGLTLHLTGYPLAQRLRIDYLMSYGPTYLLHSALQEFVGRGVLLGMMLRIFDSTTWRQRQLSNLAVSVMFALTHIHFGLAAVGLTMAFSLLLGTYYMVHRNLVGPVLIHTVLGMAAFMFGLI